MPVLETLLTRRELIRNLVKKDLLSRYTGSFLGFLWALINPLAMVAIYYFVCSIVFKLKLKESTYGFFEFLLCGLWSWIAFSEGINRACSVVVEQAYLVKKVFFPSEVLVLVVIISSMVQHLVGTGIFGLYLIIFKINTVKAYWWHLLLLPIPFTLQALFTFGLGWIVASLNVFWRDVGHVLTLLLNIWFYATPIVYPYDILPEYLQKITFINPAFIMVSFYRWILLGETILNFYLILYYLAIVLGFYVVGAIFFGKLKEDFSSVL